MSKGHTLQNFYFNFVLLVKDLCSPLSLSYTILAKFIYSRVINWRGLRIVVKLFGIVKLRFELPGQNLKQAKDYSVTSVRLNAAIIGYYVIIAVNDGQILIGRHCLCDMLIVSGAHNVSSETINKWPE